MTATNDMGNNIISLDGFTWKQLLDDLNSFLSESSYFFYALHLFLDYNLCGLYRSAPTININIQ